MRFLLDSNIIIFIIDGTNELLRARFAAGDENDFVTSAVAFAEVAHGSANGKPPPMDRLDKFRTRVPVLPFDEKAARDYATIPFKRASYDRLIAAHARSLGLTVITNNVSHFSDVPDLKVEDWTA